MYHPGQYIWFYGSCTVTFYWSAKDTSRSKGPPSLCRGKGEMELFPGNSALALDGHQEKYANGYIFT